MCAYFICFYVGLFKYFFIFLVWQKLEEQNQEFFKGYHLRLMVKDQIMEFNKLLDRQAALMHQLGPTGVTFQPKSNGSQLSKFF